MTLQSAATAGTQAGGQGGQRQTRALVGEQASHRTAPRGGPCTDRVRVPPAGAPPGLGGRQPCAPRGPHADMLTFSECSLWARSCTKHFTGMTSERQGHGGPAAGTAPRISQPPSPSWGPPPPDTARKGVLSTPGQRAQHRAGRRLLARPGHQQPGSRGERTLSRCVLSAASHTGP